MDKGSLLRAPPLPLHDADLVNSWEYGGACAPRRPWVPKHDIKMAKRHRPETESVSQTECGAGEVTLGPSSYSE